MQKALFTLLIVTLFCGNALSQPFGGGFFAGFSASQVEGDTHAGFDKFGITAGGYITKKHLRNTNWKAEIRYIQRGSAKQPTETDPSLYRLTIHYVEFPLLYQYNLNDRITFDAGLSPDVYLFHKEEDENGEISQDDRPAYHRVGLNGDIGGYYRLTENIIFGLRYSNSILPMRDHASGQTYLLNRGQYNRLFHFSVYYHFE